MQEKCKTTRQSWFLEHPKVYYIPNYSMTRCGYFILGRGIEKNPTRYRILICLPRKKLGFTHHPITSITVTTKMITFLLAPEIPTKTFICHWHVVIGGTPSRKNNMENPFFFKLKQLHLQMVVSSKFFHLAKIYNIHLGINLHLQKMFTSTFTWNSKTAIFKWLMLHCHVNFLGMEIQNKTMATGSLPVWWRPRLAFWGPWDVKLLAPPGGKHGGQS